MAQDMNGSKARKGSFLATTRSPQMCMPRFENETHEEDAGEAKRRVPSDCVNDGIAKHEIVIMLTK